MNFFNFKIEIRLAHSKYKPLKKRQLFLRTLIRVPKRLRKTKKEV